MPNLLKGVWVWGMAVCFFSLNPVWAMEKGSQSPGQARWVRVQTQKAAEVDCERPNPAELIASAVTHANLGVLPVVEAIGLGKSRAVARERELQQILDDFVEKMVRVPGRIDLRNLVKGAKDPVSWAYLKEQLAVQLDLFISNGPTKLFRDADEEASQERKQEFRKLLRPHLEAAIERVFRAELNRGQVHEPMESIPHNAINHLADRFEGSLVKVLGALNDEKMRLAATKVFQYEQKQHKQVEGLMAEARIQQNEIGLAKWKEKRATALSEAERKAGLGEDEKKMLRQLLDTRLFSTLNNSMQLSFQFNPGHVSQTVNPDKIRPAIEGLLFKKGTQWDAVVERRGEGGDAIFEKAKRPFSLLPEFLKPKKEVKKDPKIEAYVETGEHQRAVWEYRKNGNQERADELEHALKMTISEHLKNPKYLSSVKDNSQGKNKSYELTLDDGTQLLFKPHSGLSDAHDLGARDNLNAGPFADFVDRSLGLNSLPLSFNGEFRGQKGSFIVMVPNSLSIQQYQGQISTSKEKVDKDVAMIKAAPPSFNLFHFLILDSDHYQHLGNDMVTFPAGKNASQKPYFFTIDPGLANTPRSANEFGGILTPGKHPVKDAFVHSLLEDQPNLDDFIKKMKGLKSDAKKRDFTFFHDTYGKDSKEFFLKRVSWLIRLAEDEKSQRLGKPPKKPLDLGEEYSTYLSELKERNTEFK